MGSVGRSLAAVAAGLGAAFLIKGSMRDVDAHVRANDRPVTPEQMESLNAWSVRRAKRILWQRRRGDVCTLIDRRLWSGNVVQSNGRGATVANLPRLPKGTSSGALMERNEASYISRKSTLCAEPASD
mmetsp:Transcript_37487/g.69073  ORF Transcript_37487/g.69073 Transcript_37487/m.69073 type:complete len:128 (-) Transcript_37487:315-698(-)